jgi:aldose 1-epimerase
MQTAQRYSLSNEFLDLELIPEWGGRLSRLRVVESNRDLIVPIESDAFDPLNWPRAGAYPLVPFSNRIANARLTFEGKSWDFPAHPAASPHALHGVGHTVKWSVDRPVRDNQITMRMAYEGPHWPWAFSATQQYRLRGLTLEHEMSVTNDSDRAMPVGLGFHPFLTIGPQSRAVFDAGRSWSIGADALPDGQWLTLSEPTEWKAQEHSGKEFVGYFSEWSGRAEVLSEAGKLTLSAGPSFSHFVVFVPASGAFLCLEPVSHVANGFNLDASGLQGTGTRTLWSGQTWTERVQLTWCSD